MVNMHREKYRFMIKALPYLMILPALVIYSIFLILPVVENFIFSLVSWESGVYEGFIGLTNYSRMLLRDPLFIESLVHNLMWVGLLILFPVVIGLVIAATLAGKIKGRLFFSTIYFIPYTIPLVVASTAWVWMYNPLFGPVNIALKTMGLSHLARGWLGESRYALLALSLCGSWTHLGFCVLIFLSSLQGVDPSLYEAAWLDGASSLKSFFYITVPSLRRTLVFIVLYSFIVSMKIFAIVWTATSGGPSHATEVIETYMFWLYFREDKLSYASTAVSILTIIVLVISAIAIYPYRRTSERG